MKIEYSHYEFPETGRITFATDKEKSYPYFEMVRTNFGFNNILRYAMEFLDKQDEFIDVGANVGFFTIPLAKSGRRVLAIEPMPNNYLLLLKGLQASQIHNVSAVNVAANDTVGLAYMEGEGPWSRINHSDSGVPVASLTLDDIAEVNSFTKAKLVKIDTEGAEIRVLNGMKKLIDSNTDLQIVFESNSHHCRRQGYRPQDLIRSFEQLGFDVFMFHHRSLIPRGSGDLQEQCVVDYLATRQPNSLIWPTRALSVEERISMVLEMTDSGSTPHMLHVVEALNDAPDEILGDMRVKQRLSLLRNSPNAVIRDAAEQLHSL